MVPDTGLISVNIGRGGSYGDRNYDGGDTVVEAGWAGRRVLLRARGGTSRRGKALYVYGWRGGCGWSGGGGCRTGERGGRGGSNGSDGEAATGNPIDPYSGFSKGGWGKGAVVLPSIPGLVLTPGWGGESLSFFGGGGGGVSGNAEPEWRDETCGEGYGAGGGGVIGSWDGSDEVVVI